MKARLHIQTACKDGRTWLAKSYQEPPFKVADITEDKKAGWLHLMLMCSSPGVLDGDDYHWLIELQEHSRLQLHTQSYQRLFDMKQGAVQRTQVRVAAGASLVYLPHPSVPHERSVYKAVNEIYLQPGSRLLWGEVLTCGRKGNGEMFRFSKYHSLTSVFLQNKLVIKENLLIEPANIDMGTIGQWEGYTHQASLICIDPKMNVPGLADKIHAFLSEQPEVTVGVSELPVNGLMVRLLGYKAEQLYELIKEVANGCTLQQREATDPHTTKITA